jgi:hypothetical protein
LVPQIPCFQRAAAKVFHNKELAAFFRPEKPMGDAPEDIAHVQKTE